MRQYPGFIGRHIRAHSNLPGRLASGNDKVDKLVAVCQQMTLYDCAQASHSLHHQNASSTHKKFRLTREQAVQNVRLYPQCVVCSPTLPTGVNPHGLPPNQLWQMDVTHILQFGKTCYIHITVDTYS